MKKLILLLFTVGVCAAVSVAAADDLQDNSLQIDNSRLEREEELNFGAQSERIKALFNAADQKKLQEKGDNCFLLYRGQLRKPKKSSYFSQEAKRFRS